MAQQIMGQLPIYLSITNLLVMFIPIQDGTAFKEQRYSKTYYYLSVIALIISVANYMAGNEWLKNIIRFASSDKGTGDEEESALYKDIENNLLIDYSHEYPYFRVTKRIDLQGQQMEPVRREKLKELR